MLGILKGKQELKQAIVVRTDLEMNKGKIAAQVSHASIASYLKVNSTEPKIAKEWIDSGMKKIVLKVSGEKELFKYFQQCKGNEIPCELIRDAGHTQIPQGSVTCFGAGPFYEEKIDKILGKLKLL
ncbi:MAG: peptidyl-tRNA hydrolase Pth2 [Candidatus Micrarchaeia archaeon]